jgi:hypothetical protein
MPLNIFRPTKESCFLIAETAIQLADDIRSGKVTGRFNKYSLYPNEHTTLGCAGGEVVARAGFVRSMGFMPGAPVSNLVAANDDPETTDVADVEDALRAFANEMALCAEEML